ncbi:hypothetical protein WNY37_00240 [Henriciella sp. AS95]|uniref:hypothetical protein n=1 Tax=Henriciella sp. AS95 TaxID=3135782 RepID=UPI00316AF042
MKLVRIDEFTSEGLYRQEAVYCSKKRGRKYTVFFEVPETCAKPATYDHFALYGIAAAFVLDEDYEHLGAVDQRLLEQVEDVIDIWHDWYPYRHRTQIVADVRTVTDSDGTAPDAGQTGCLFTAGVDSLYSLLKCRGEIDALISVIHRNSIHLPFRSETDGLDEIDQFAQRMNVSHLTISTNMMTAIPEYQDAWAHLSHGAAYAAATHFLSGEISHAIISSSLNWDQLMPWGSHPDTDWRFGSSTLSLDHFGTSTSRIDKTAAVARNPEFLRVLNVCSRGRQSSEHLNCSKCQKCLRTMLAIDLAGIDRDQATSFDWTHYTPANAEKIYLRTENEYLLFEEILARAVELDRQDVVEPIERLIQRSRKFVWLTTMEMEIRKRLPRVARMKSTAMKTRNVVYNVFGLSTRLKD